jgi:hypothetical protein
MHKILRVFEKSMLTLGFHELDKPVETANAYSHRNSKTDGKSGSYGIFFPLSDKLGIKVFYKCGYITIEELYASWDYRDATQECLNLVRAKKLLGKSVPKLYMFIIIKRLGKYYPAMIVEKINGREVSTEDRDDLLFHTWLKFKKRLRAKLRQLGIEHTDLHTDNVMVTGEGKGRRYYIIDWGHATVPPTE